MQAKHILEGAANLVARGWCQGASARNACGDPVYPKHHTATSYCLSGALVAANDHAHPAGEAERAWTAIKVELAARNEPSDPVAWNDEQGRRPGEVAAVLRGAARRV